MNYNMNAKKAFSKQHRNSLAKNVAVPLAFSYSEQNQAMFNDTGPALQTFANPFSCGVAVMVSPFI